MVVYRFLEIRNLRNMNSNSTKDTFDKGAGRPDPDFITNIIQIFSSET